MLTQFKEKLNAVEPQSKTATFLWRQFPVSNHSPALTGESTTPPGSPPVDLRRALGLQQDGSISTPPPTAAPNTSSILEALANMARQSGQGAPNPPALTQPQENSYNMPIAQSNPAPQIAANRLQFPPIPPSVNVPTPMATFAQQPQGGSNGVQASANNQTLPFAAPSPVVSSPFNVLDPAAQQQLMLIKALADQGFTPDKIAGVITAMGGQGLAPPPPPVGAGGFPPPPPQFAAQNLNGWGSRSEESRDHIDPVRSPHGRFGGRRSRSRSPVSTWNARDSPNSRRREPDFDFGDRNRGGDRGRGRGSRGGMDDYRQRSPARRRSPSPPETNGGGKKWIEYDNSIPKGSIKGMNPNGGNGDDFC
jgi:protein NRD1